MLNLASRAPAVEAPEPIDHNQYTVASRLEITQILRSIMRQNALITATSGDDSFFLTSIVAVDEENDSLLIECARQQRQTAMILQQQRLMCSTALDKVKVEFTCEGIEVVGAEHDRAFKMPLPRSMVRLQRRENFRMGIPLSANVRCTISPLDQQPAQAARIELTVHDISCGGIAVMTPPALFTPELGGFYNIVIGLPGTGGVAAKVQARNAFAVTMANSKVTQRSGFAFVRPAESLLATIQRFIMNLERARRQNSRER